MKARMLCDEAETCRRLGDEAGALSRYLSAAERAADAFEPALEAEAMLGVGQLRALADDCAGAVHAFEEAVARAVEGGVAEIEAEAWLSMAQVCFNDGRSKDGHDALLEALALYRDMPGESGRRGLARAVHLYGEHIGVLGDEGEAHDALELARLMFMELGDTAGARGIAEDLEKIREWAR